MLSERSVSLETAAFGIVSVGIQSTGKLLRKDKRLHYSGAALQLYPLSVATGYPSYLTRAHAGACVIGYLYHTIVVMNIDILGLGLYVFLLLGSSKIVSLLISCLLI